MNTQTRKKLFALVGGTTAAATATGGVAVANIAPVGAEVAGVANAQGAANVAGAGTLESCSAYFGYGKDDAAVGLVEFDVADVNGSDGADHGVDLDGDGDTDVVFVLEYESGDVVECEPFEVTEDMWNDEYGGDDAQFPDYPGPGHYVYPSVALQDWTDQDDPVVSAGFRVSGVPADHTLVSPEGLQPLVDPFLPPDSLAFDGATDPRVLDFIEAEVGPAAAAAYGAALQACAAEDDIDGTDPDLHAGFDALTELAGIDVDEDDLDCLYVSAMQAEASYVLGVIESVGYVEEIRLQVPEAPTTTVDPTTTTTSTPANTPGVAPAAEAVTASPTFTG